MNNLIKYGCFLCFKGSPLKKCFVDNAGSDRSVLFKSLIFHETPQKNIMIFLFTEVYRVPFNDSTKQMLARTISFFPFYKCRKFGYTIRISNLIYTPAVCLWVISVWLDGTQHELAPEKKNSHVWVSDDIWNYLSISISSWRVLSQESWKHLSSLRLFLCWLSILKTL